MNKWLAAILVIGAVLRLWGLDSNPPHLISDEAALGYNAYSILQTARDEHGALLPVIFQSFGDWKPGLYIYLTVPFVAILGLTEFTTRLPGALSGIVAVWLIYLVVLELFEGRGRKAEDRSLKTEDRRQKVALVAAFFLAISPWHLQFSRGAWEAGVSLTLTLTGIYFFLRAIRDKQSLSSIKPRWIMFSAFFFGLTLLTYQGAKLATGIVVLGLLLAYRREVLNWDRKILAKAALVGVILALPVMASFVQGKTGRLAVFSVFSYRRSEVDVVRILEQGEEQQASLSYWLYHSEPLNLTRGVLGRWFNHFSGRFLFFEGDFANPRHGVPHAGVVLVLDAVFLVAGLVALSRMGARKETLFLWFWLLLAPLPAALSRDSIHAVRSFNMVAPLTIILALGAGYLWERRSYLGRSVPILYSLFSILYLSNYIYYLDQYWVHAPRKNSQEWHYGYKQMVQTITPIQDKYEEIVVQQNFAQPYIFFLFYQRHDPAKYQAVADEVFTSSKFGDVGLVSRVDNIIFRDLNWSADQNMTGKLFVLDTIEVPLEQQNDPERFKLINEIKYLDGDTAFRLIEAL